MTRSTKGTKPPGMEWGKRYKCDKHHGAIPGKVSKQLANKERRRDVNETLSVKSGVIMMRCGINDIELSDRSISDRAKDAKDNLFKVKAFYESQGKTVEIDDGYIKKLDDLIDGKSQNN